MAYCCRAGYWAQCELESPYWEHTAVLEMSWRKDERTVLQNWENRALVVIVILFFTCL